MKTPVDCNEAKQLIPAYAIGATDADETRIVDRAVMECPEVMAELTDYLSVANALQSVVTPAKTAPKALPASLIARLDEPIAREDRHNRLDSASVPPVIALPPRRNRWLLMGAVAAAIAVLLLTNVYWFSEVNTLKDQQTRLENQLAMQPTSNDLLTNISLQTVQHRQLLPQENASDAQATVLWNSENRVGSLYVTGLPALHNEQVYQFWLVRDGHSLSLGTFEVDENGVGTLIFESNENIEDFSAMGVSPEPANGSSEPTAPHIVIGEI
ncbi:MAG: anti-sigma factor [Aggregatilineales bacterium]